MPANAVNHKNGLVFGVHPYLNSTVLMERFSPLTEYLADKIGTPISIKVAQSYQDHISAVRQGEIDFAFMGPAPFLKLMTEKKDFSLLGKLSFSGKNTYRGAIIVRRESPLTSVRQLQGKRFAFGDPNSTLSSLVPAQILRNAGVELTDLKTHSHIKNHHNVALAVLMGKYDAGGVKEEVFREYQSRGLRVLKWSPDIPSHNFIASLNISTEQIVELRQLLLELHLQPEGDSILQKIKKGTTAIIPAAIEDYVELHRFIYPRPKTELAR